MMFILFDTNVWFSELGLQSHHGAAVRYFARMRNATVAIPEIVELEVQERLTAHLLDLKKQTEKNHRKLLAVLGKLPPSHLPSEEEVRKAVRGIIPDFDVPVRRLPFNEDVARSSMMKALRRIPPSAKSEQFRDGVIWAHCMELLSEGDVYLVSGDKDFCHPRDGGKDLAPELVEEMRRRSETREIKLVQNLTQLLQDIRIPIRLEETELFKSITEQQNETVDEILSSNGFELCGHVKGEINCFATEEAQKVYFTFSFAHPCQDSTGASRHSGELVLKGSGFLDPETRRTNEVQISNILLDYPDWEPGGPMRGIAFGYARSSTSEVHQIRFSLDPMEGEGTNLSN